MIGKKSFVLYSDLKNVLDKLPDEEAGKLFKTILDYVNDLNPEPTELITQVAFEPIRQQLKRDLEKWNKSLVGKSKAGQMSAAQRALFSTPVESVQQESTVSVSVTDNVNWDKLIEVYNLIFDTKKRIIAESIRKKFRARLKEGYTKKDIIMAMKNANKDEFHKSTSPPQKHLTLEFFSRPEKLDRFMEESKPTKYTPTK